MTNEEAIKHYKIRKSEYEDAYQRTENIGHKKAVEFCDLAIQALEKQIADRWIPVSERLPSDEECNRFDNLHPLNRKFLCTIQIGNFNPQSRVMYFSKVFGWKYGADDYNEYVTAWRPLPEPYRRRRKCKTY